jgi:uncharacterized protein (DUF58 family)
VTDRESPAAARPASAVLDETVAQRVAGLRIQARRVVEGLRSGIHRSPHRGASVIFAEHREYRPGDDLRLLDWRAYARNDRDSIKRFEQETHLRAHLLLDVSASMAYGDDDAAGARKCHYAATLLAAIALILLGQGDAVGAYRAPESADGWLPARNRPDQLDLLLRLLAREPEPRSVSSLDTALTALAERVGRRGLVVVASDLLDFDPHGLDALSRLRARGNDVLVFQVLHPHELELPFDERLRFVDLEGEASLDVDASELRATYREEVQRFIDGCRARCIAAGARHALARTDLPVQQVIAGALHPQAAAWG